MGEIGVHRVYKCIHGVIVQQCRCPDRYEKRVVIVDCPPECADPVYCGLCGKVRNRCMKCGRICDCGLSLCNWHVSDEAD